MNIYFDMETIPGQKPEVLAQIIADAETAKQNIKVPKTHKKPEAIESYIAEKSEEIDAGIDDTYRKTALDGSVGQIATISIAVDDGNPLKFYHEAYAESEAQTVAEFFDEIRSVFRASSMTRPVFVGHNILNFDLPFLWKRAVILGIKPPAFIPFKAKPWDSTVFDTMIEWAGLRNTISQDRLSRALGNPGKGDIDGSKVWDYVKDGRIAEVAEYCASDVIAVRENFNRMTFSTGLISMSFEKQPDGDIHVDAPENYSAEGVQCYLFALLDEANRRGSMFPQTKDEQQSDSDAVHQVCEMVAWYGKQGEPKPKKIEDLRRLRAMNTNTKE